MTKSLTELKELFPSALYSYFRVLNFKAALQAFLENPQQNPRLVYHSMLTPKYVADRYDDLLMASQEAATPAARVFAERRLQETQVLNLFLELCENDQPDFELVDAYRQQMEQLYGPLDQDLFNGAMTYLEAVAQRLNRQDLLEAVKTQVSWEPALLYQPKPATFKHYQQHVQELFPNLFKPVAKDYEAVREITAAIKTTGLGTKGWQAKLKTQGTGILISAQRKVVAIGDSFHPLNGERLQQVIAHEIYGHAMRAEFGSLRVRADEEEGLAVAMEQLVLPHFYYKRVLRYLALCLAWGIDGQPRDFKDTYQVLLPIATIVNGDPEAAKTIAFRECVRAFRGGNPNVPGAILTKDKVYLEGNLVVWQSLEEAMLNADEFKEVIQGHATILGRNEYDK